MKQISVGVDKFIDFLKSLVKEEDKASGEKAPAVPDEKARAELEESIDEIERAYENSPFRSYGGYKIANVAERKYDAPTDEDIREKAESVVGADKEVKAASLKKKAEEAREAYEESKRKNAENAEKTAAKISEAAAAARENARNDAIRRGLGRSSVIVNGLGDITEAEISSKGEIYGEADRAAREIDGKIAALRVDLSEALDKLDLDSAVAVNDEIKKLSAEREAKKRETDEYNASVRAAEAKQLNALKNKGVAVGDEDEEGYIKANSEKLNALYAYYYAYGDAAKEQLESDEAFVKSKVGVGGYNYLRNLMRG